MQAVSVLKFENDCWFDNEKNRKKRTPMFYMGRISRLYFHAVKHFDGVSPFCFQFVMHTCTVTFTLFDVCVWSILYMYCCFLFDFWSNWQLCFRVKRNTGKMLLSFCQAFFKQWLPFQELFSQKRNSALCSFSQLCFVCSILFYIISELFLWYFQTFSSIVIKYGVIRKHTVQRPE